MSRVRRTEGWEEGRMGGRRTEGKKDGRKERSRGRNTATLSGVTGVVCHMGRILRPALVCLISAALSAPASAQVTSASTGSGGPGTPVINSGPPPPPVLPEGSGAISGVVTDGATGQPVAGAIVSLSVTSRATIARTAREMTDSRGRFLFTKLAA